jgi:alpha-glucosidase
MNYYFIHGPQMEDVVTSYTDLTGKPELPPLWVTTNVNGVIFGE